MAKSPAKDDPAAPGKLAPSAAKSAAPIRMTTARLEAGMAKVTATRALEWYVRAMAVFFFGAGLVQWAILIGLLSWNEATIFDLSRPMQAAMVYFAVIDLVAAVGLWLAAPWGGVVWLLSAMSRIMLHTTYMTTFGQENLSVALLVVSILIYMGLTWLQDRQARRIEI